MSAALATLVVLVTVVVVTGGDTEVERAASPSHAPVTGSSPITSEDGARTVVDPFRSVITDWPRKQTRLGDTTDLAPGGGYRIEVGDPDGIRIQSPYTVPGRTQVSIAATVENESEYGIDTQFALRCEQGSKNLYMGYELTVRNGGLWSLDRLTIDRVAYRRDGIPIDDGKMATDFRSRPASIRLSCAELDDGSVRVAAFEGSERLVDEVDRTPTVPGDGWRPQVLVNGVGSSVLLTWYEERDLSRSS